MPSEHRALPRKRLKSVVPVTNDDTGEAVGRIFDITVEGFMLLTQQTLAPDTLFNFSFSLPDERIGPAEIKLQAVCVWCQGSSFSEEFGAGFRLANLSPIYKPAFQRLVAEF
ncbi:PilZ domain-containing protein [Aestuariirhabdus litorea]|uniref:PilZ domain-containing protein n=1 Tax=Aestuariirhabdus litorea TaxID=2528527 RepID=A0A3P3VKU7_9GAMM|nr:PilZ domain-containing protein [Aestuariirhabdus litorea]RRJ82498.1 PilZ domain-containing protein [Aestuariirhabdus litorea]RWW92659.1 PilZ domain-containing protein [Endozoicomonadaceae bacterium GTF-13]